MKLKKKHFKLISALYVKGKKVGIDIPGAVKSLFKGTVTSIDDQELIDFREGLSESDKVDFDMFDHSKQKSIVALTKEKHERSMKMIEVADMFVEYYGDLETELDAIVCAATGKSQEDIDDMDMVDYANLIREMFKENGTVFTGSHQQK